MKERMISSIKVNEVIKNWEPDDFKIVQKYETVDALWGLELRQITDDDIKALKEGKYLYCDNGEYAQIISYEKSEGEEQIVRCCQCKYSEVADSEDNQDGYTCQFHRGSIWFSGSYCSWAERKENDG